MIYFVLAEERPSLGASRAVSGRQQWETAADEVLPVSFLTDILHNIHFATVALNYILYYK